jgi:hypothetical protein
MIKLFLPLVVFVSMFRCSLIANDGVGEDMVEAANNLLASLSADQRAEINFEVNDTSREIWHFLPVASFDRFGLPLSSLDDAQDQLVYDLIEASLSEEGFEKAEQIMGLELILKAMENNAPRRDPQQYHISIYGIPSAEGIWSWGFSGHHISLHFTMVDGELASTPTFLGSNPGEVREGAKKGLRVLKDEEDKGFALINALSSEQAGKAIFLKEAPYEIFTAANSVALPQDNLGITYTQLEPAQQKMLEAIVQEYLDVMPTDIKTARKEKIDAAGWDMTYFAWAGETDRGGGHYYRVQGPTFLIEFDNTQNEANHVHSVWRDFKGDFGRDLIMEHYKKSH